ncbi:helix-turn-helix domain-containing protein [Myroides pelagicus]|uniref:winged helix-turn-helix transcriptional regulator n=1 Tax=Myroides pelagicus TaxID=270914 RepID=UPI002DB92BE5|nr:helix-turn-helix domain-containing protein [Myroides pelagicus]MEC4114276.1 helix-turn-helix domain-containing protein [Myroides pelagicus]
MTKNKHIECLHSLLPIRDAIDVISGKWKLQIIVSIWSGNQKFKEIERSIPKLTAKVLTKELKDLEEYKLIKRTVYDESPIRIQYTLEPHAKSLEPLIMALRDFGLKHRKEVLAREYVINK